MNENVGASFGLSVLVVLFFAVALYHPDKPSSRAGVKAAPAEVAEARPPDEAVAPHTRSTTKETREAPSLPPPRSVPVPTAKVVTGPGRGVTPAAPGRAVSRRVVEPGPAGPRGAFTSARAGERLEDVARRVYGSEMARERLWKANRDLIDGPDRPLRTGMLVRTP